MDDLEEPSLLEYARTHGIARNHRELDPLGLFDQIRDSEHAQVLSLRDAASQIFDLETTEFKYRISTITARNEKLVLDRDGARFLSSVLREVISLQARPDHNAEEPISFECPKYQSQNDLKIDAPLLSTEKESRLKTLSKRTDPVSLLDEIVPDLADHERVGIDEGLEFPDYFWELPSMFDRDPSTEKLEACKDTARILHDAVGYFDEKKHREGVEELINSSILDKGHFSHIPTPLYIESEEQHNSNVISEPPHSIDSDTDTDHVNKAVTEDFVTTETLEDNPRVGDGVNNQQTASSLAINETMKDSGRSPEAEVTVFPITETLVSFSGSLGTLSAFMQTRGHKNKRRKLDNESRHFRITPKDSTKTDADKPDTLEEHTEHTKVPSSPVVVQEVQGHNLYPKDSLGECRTPLILIVFTQLLRSDSALIRSLENISSSRSVQLIFRDHEGLKCSQPHAINEVDLIVSPTTGVILANSHETTQKYLPGQGPPGIESPLQARIVQSAPRYETLYVLVRSPIQTDMKTLSSIRELTTYCISMNHVCDIKVLLIATEHVLEWILSVAAKHTTDIQLTSPQNTAKGKTAGVQFCDDQTQWEAFLRNAGLNPFAAQSVLALLKTKSAESKRPENVMQASALSRFVEMPCQERRDMFQEIVGQRVLSRVERALEMDWQVDWAVDLV